MLHVCIVCDGIEDQNKVAWIIQIGREKDFFSMLFFFSNSIRNKKNEKNTAIKKGKDIERSVLTATFVPSSQNSKVDNRIISQVADNTIVNNEDPVQITYRPTSKNK